MKKLIKKLLPKFLLGWYHLALAVLANVVYGFPSRKLIVIGVTGTKGKSTTSNMIWKVLTEAGNKVGMTTTANIRIADKEWINDTKMTMQGRFALQKLIKQMVAAGCKYAVIETSSEGILQHRHIGIKYQIAVFTNLMPEHLDRHGTFLNYRFAKGVLFKNISGQNIIIANQDDKNADYFLAFPAYKHITFGIEKDSDFKAEALQFKNSGSYFLVNDNPFYTPLLGRFNIYNALAAIAVGRSQNIDWKHMQKAFKEFKKMPGRMEEIKSPKGFSVFVDYAHTAESLELVYKTLKPRANRLIAVLGAAGGGRDKAKRPILGKIAGKYADIAIITNEDPYDEDPTEIIDQVWAGLENFEVEKYKMQDRAEAIKKSLILAQKGDVVVITGKGSEQCIVTKRGKLKWDDREVVKNNMIHVIQG